MREYAIAAIPADGIGREVIAAGLEVLQELAQKAGSFHLKVEVFPWGSDDYKQHSTMMPKDGRERLHPFCAITLAPSALLPLRYSAIFWIIRLLALRRTPTRPKCRPTAQRWWKFPNKPAAET